MRHTELRNYISFRISQLAQRNEHHHFETICRLVAARRICSNILPATGPVGAGGDQGMDFETFESFLTSDDLGTSSAFVGLVSNERLAFAATLTSEKKLPFKIKSDLEAIKAWGKASKAYVFCGSPFPIAKRHKLQKWSRETHGLDLEVIDIEAISDWLATPDLSWISVEHLGVPAEMLPTDAGDEWYGNLVALWWDKPISPNDYECFADLKRGLRAATFDEAKKADLGQWIVMMERMRDESVLPDMVRRSSYEVIVAVLRGKGNLDGYESRVTAHLARCGLQRAHGDVEDDVVIVRYCQVAIMHGHLKLSPEPVAAAWDRVARLLEELIETCHERHRCAFMEMQGYHRMVRRPGEFDVEGTIATWVDMLRRLGDDDWFDVERFSGLVNKLLEFGAVDAVSDAKYRELMELVDKHVARQAGRERVAQACRDRALVFYRRGKILRAIEELHEAKNRWLTRDTVRGAIIACGVLGQFYRELGLFHAAKYYSLACAATAVQLGRPEDLPVVGSALGQVIECDYFMGAFLTMLEEMHQAMPIVQACQGSGDRWYERFAFYGALAHLIARECGDKCEAVLVKRAAELGLTDIVGPDDLEAARVASGNADLIGSAAKAGMVLPLSDTGALRCSVFGALGVAWRFTWANTEMMNAIAEEFLACFQVLLADLASLDLVVQPVVIDARVSMGHAASVTEQSEGGNMEAVLVNIKVPAGSGEDVDKSMAVCAIGLLSMVSLLPEQELADATRKRIERGLPSKVLFVGRYPHLLSRVLGGVPFDAGGRAVALGPEWKGAAWCATELSWRSGRAPMFKMAEARQQVANRYDGCRRIMGSLWGRLWADGTWRRTVRALRMRGWLDWHIMLAATNIALNNEVAPSGMLAASADEVKDMRAKMNNLAQSGIRDKGLWLGHFGEGQMQLALEGAVLASVTTLGLVNRCSRVINNAIRKVLDERFGYSTIDVTHRNLAC